MKNISRRSFLAFGCCAAGAALCPAFVPAAGAATNSADVNQLLSELGSTKKAPAALDAWIDDPAAQKIEPYQAFGNVWQVGIAWVSSWAVKTSDGWVLIDTTHEPYVDVLLDNLRKVGIAQDDIRMVLMTHGHFDHVGGYYRLKPLLKNARFVMTERGWNEAFRYARESKGTHREWTMLEEKDVVAGDGETLTCGDSVFTVLETPGHTWGTASYMYDVHRGDKRWKAVTVGGQGLNAIESTDQVRAYIKSMNRLCEDSLGIEVDLTAHPYSSGLADMIPAIRALRPSDPHPLVNRAAYVARLGKLNENAEARLKIELDKAAGKA